MPDRSESGPPVRRPRKQPGPAASTRRSVPEQRHIGRPPDPSQPPPTDPAARAARLRAAWQQHLALPAERLTFSPWRPERGWLLQVGMPELIAPYAPDVVPGPHALLPFTGLDAPTAARLLEVLPVPELADRQNAAPMLGTLLRAAVAHPGRITLTGYCVGPGRPDERITVTTAYVAADPDGTDGSQVARGRGHLDDHARCWCQDAWRHAQSLGLDDALAPPDELDLSLDPDDPLGPGHWRLWWD